ncbi:hypothetical protein [Sulfurirhabdus autotrophica]|nr:hypothetical protein [Sulfurirhabdus autotrophica]
MESIEVIGNAIIKAPKKGDLLAVSAAPNNIATLKKSFRKNIGASHVKLF